MCFLICIREYLAILNSDTRKSIRNSKKPRYYILSDSLWNSWDHLEKSVFCFYLIYYSFIHVCDTALILFLTHYPLTSFHLTAFPPPASMSVLSVHI